MLKKLYDKSKIWFAVTWIISYCVLFSLGDGISSALGVEKSVTLVVGLGLSMLLFLFLKKWDLLENYGITLSKASPRSMLYYIPIFALLSANFFYGVTLNYTILETILYILAMFCVGFLEEVIFRGLLFNAMREGNIKPAVIVSSLTFGIGHIINLINGSGAELLPNLMQVIYATAAGFMFVMMYLKEGSLVAAIITHGLFNATSAFANDVNATPTMRILTAVFITVITGAYGAYLAISMHKNAENKRDDFADKDSDVQHSDH